MNDHKWTPQDNAIAEIELKISRGLTRELRERPAIHLNYLVASVKVQRKLSPLMAAAVQILGHVPMVHATEFGVGPDRVVHVAVE